MEEELPNTVRFPLALHLSPQVLKCTLRSPVGISYAINRYDERLEALEHKKWTGALLPGSPPECLTPFYPEAAAACWISCRHCTASSGLMLKEMSQGAKSLVLEAYWLRLAWFWKLPVLAACITGAHWLE
jgi:hypothetical protein